MKGMMEKPGAGGRPKAAYTWEHVTVLEGKKQVECKHCGLVFAASANRIKSHIYQIKGMGIRPCPYPQKEKDRLLDSQALQIVDRSRDYNKLNERMFDCYVSPKTMWEGIKDLQEIQISRKDLHQEKIKVGPFYVSNTLNERDRQMIQYVFKPSSEMSILFSSQSSFLYQYQLATLGPQTHLDASIIDIFADMLTEIERRRTCKPLNWYLPVKFSSAALNNVDGSFFLDFSKRHNMISNYMSDLVDCEKIFIPVHVEKKSCGHYYLYIIQMKNQVVEIWDSLCDQFMDKNEREQTTQKLLLAMDRLFGDGMFTKFYGRMASNILLQPNGYDCGVFVINYMQQVDNYVRKTPLFQFDSDEERLNLALKLLKSDSNLKRETLYDEAARMHYTQVESEEDLNLCGIKRKRVDKYKAFQDGGRGYMELDDSDNQVKRNNAGLRTECVKGYILPSTDLMGKMFQGHIQQICEWIMKNEASTIGIWGMGGVGKTTLATHVHNKLLEEAAHDFDYIIWVTMSQYDNGIYELQKAIARSINLDISDEHDVKRIAGKLLQASKHIKRCVLVLDDVWDPIFLEEVGFPVSNDGIKLILTTRSWEVCQSMNCMETTIIHVKPLDEEDGWALFKRTLGIHQMQSNDMKPIASVVASRCGGLPLAIITIARSMKGRTHTREWNHLLECLQNFDYGQYHMFEKLFSVLKASYYCLNIKSQSFFLYYGLSAKEHLNDNDIESLIRRFFYGGWRYKTKSLEMQYNEVYTMLDKLKNNSLLIEEKGLWQMHTLLRGMAIDIAKKNCEIMTKSCMNLMELPENEGWEENLQKIILTECNIQKIPDGTCPKCPKLSTLLLDCNYELKRIPDDFFNNMPALEILDLSRTGIERLPESVSNLECLTVLLLSLCEELRYVPSLAKLQRLIELDLSFTAITEAPHGLELLANLRYLNLEGAHQLKISSSTISKMTNLQSLRLINRTPKSIDVSIQDLQGLRKLEVISVNFCDIEVFNAYVKSFSDRDRLLKSYCLSLATLYHSAFFVVGREASSLKRAVLSGIDLAERGVVLPTDINELFISNCNHWTRTTCLCHVLSFRKNDSNLPKIEYLEISGCAKLEYLCCVSSTCLFWSCVQLVQALSLKALNDLKQIMADLKQIMIPFLNWPFLYLKDLYICECNRVKIMMTLEMLALLRNLEKLFIKFCESMEEIVGENASSSDNFNSSMTLPKLRHMELNSLPALTVVFRGTMLCPSLKYFEASNCEKLSRPPRIEIVQGSKIPMEEISTGYYWKCDNQQQPR